MESPMAKINVAVKIGGMHCAACVRTVEKTLSAVPDVISATVNLATEKAWLTVNRLPDFALIRKALSGAGYELIGVEGEPEFAGAEMLRRSQRKQFWRIVVGFVTGVLLMSAMLVGNALRVNLHFVQLLIATPVFIFLGWPIFRSAGIALTHRQLNMDVMYALGIGVAYLASLMGTFEIVLTHEFMFYETAIFLATFLSLGRYLEARAKGKTSAALQRLLDLQPKTAWVVRDDKTEEIPVADVIVGDLVLIKPGSQVPVDGTIVAGSSWLDEALLTGESLPVFKEVNDKVIGGTLNKNGVLQVRAEQIGQATVLASIIRLVESAQSSKPPIQRLADAVVTYFFPVVLVIALLTFLFWYFIAGETLLFALSALIAVLVIACPCALGLATPTVITVGVGRGAELGILIKDGAALEVASRVGTVIFDKTGTLTTGKPEVVEIYSPQLSTDALLRYAAAVERNSEHPLGKAIVHMAEERHIELPEATDFSASGGQGVSAIIEGHSVVIGNRRFCDERRVMIPEDLRLRMQQFSDAGRTVVSVALDDQTVGLIAIADRLKNTAREAVAALQTEGYQVALISGDNMQTAQAIAARAGIKEVLAEVMPARKAEKVVDLQKQGVKVAFVGDGINDAPALAQADIGIVIGSGTDVALESGAIVLMREDLRGVVAALQLSRQVMRKIRQNLFWAFAYNIALIPVAAGLLKPLFGITFRPELGGLAMALSSVTVISLALLLKRYTPPVLRS